MLPILMEVSLYVGHLFVIMPVGLHVKQIQDNNKNNSLTDIILWGELKSNCRGYVYDNPVTIRRIKRKTRAVMNNS